MPSGSEAKSIRYVPVAVSKELRFPTNFLQRIFTKKQNYKYDTIITLSFISVVEISSFLWWGGIYRCIMSKCCQCIRIARSVYFNSEIPTKRGLDPIQGVHRMQSYDRQGGPI